MTMRKLNMINLKNHEHQINEISELIRRVLANHPGPLNPIATCFALRLLSIKLFQGCSDDMSAREAEEFIARLFDGIDLDRDVRDEYVCH